MEEVMACRACLATDVKLFNMYKYELASAYEVLTGIQMSPSDGLPHQMCSYCAALLTKCVIFQQKCTNAQQLLHLAIMQAQTVTTDYIRSIDRQAHNLTHTYTIQLNQTQELDIKHKFDLDTEPIPELSAFIDVIKDEQDYEGEFTEFGEEFCQEYKLLNDNSSDEEPLSLFVKNRDKTQDENIEDEIDEVNLQLENEKDGGNGKKNVLKDYMVKVIILTKEEQIQEIESRKDSPNYKNSLYRCDQCYKGFMLKKTFKNHMDRHDPSRGEVSCDICHIRWPDKQKLQAHVLSTHRKKYICRRCGHVSRSSHSAKEHYRWHQGVTYICDICGATFNKSTSHLTHVRLQHPSNNICETCGESFVSENGLKIHKNKAHRYEELDVNTKCALCRVWFKNTEALQTHISRGICDPNISPCLTCGANFLNEDLLKEHSKLHLKDESMNCSQCGRKFANARSHALHYQRVHLGVKMKKRPRTNAEADFVCDVCGKMCSSNAALVYHQRTHSGEKPYPCKECPKRFGIYQRLQIHMRTHTGERPFKCPHCPKAFKHKAALNRHVRVHTGVKPYECPNCGKAFSQSNTMKLHVRTVHHKLAAPYRRQRQKDNCTE